MGLERLEERMGGLQGQVADDISKFSGQREEERWLKLGQWHDDAVSRRFVTRRNDKWRRRRRKQGDVDLKTSNEEKNNDLPVAQHMINH